MDYLQLTFEEFLLAPTPDSWIEKACKSQDVLLLDHANCEKKAAASAMKLMYTYPQYLRIQKTMARLAREELRHFEQVLAIMEKRGIKDRKLSASRYASALYQQVSSSEPSRLAETLIVGAIIEARSCERFSRLIPYLDETLQRFYQRLVKSEGRHFQEYLQLALHFTNKPLNDRINQLLQKESELITSPDAQFRFHSGSYLKAS